MYRILSGIEQLDRDDLVVRDVRGVRKHGRKVKVSVYEGHKECTADSKVIHLLYLCFKLCTSLGQTATCSTLAVHLAARLTDDLELSVCH